MKRAIVTGAGHGIGAAIARALAAADYVVGVLDRDAAASTAIASALPSAIALVADVTDAQAVDDAFTRFGVLPDLVVCNAGIVRFGPLIEQSPTDLRAVVEVNLLGTMIVALAAARRMAQGGGGHVLCMTSINSRTPGPGAGAYPATKAGVAQFVRQLAIECGPAGVRVNAVSPGFIDAGMSALIYADDVTRARRAGGVPLRRLGTAEDIANAVLWLDSAGAAYVSGHELVVDGGVVHSMLAQLPRT